MMGQVGFDIKESATLSGLYELIEDALDQDRMLVFVCVRCWLREVPACLQTPAPEYRPVLMFHMFESQLFSNTTRVKPPNHVLLFPQANTKKPRERNIYL